MCSSYAISNYNGSDKNQISNYIGCNPTSIIRFLVGYSVIIKVCIPLSLKELSFLAGFKYNINSQKFSIVLSYKDCCDLTGDYCLFHIFTCEKPNLNAHCLNYEAAEIRMSRVDDKRGRSELAQILLNMN